MVATRSRTKFGTLPDEDGHCELGDSGARRAGTPELPILTPQEREIVQLIAEGYSGKGIAKRFNFSSRTVETHRSAVLRKLNVQSSRELVRDAVRNKMVEP